MRQRCVSEPEKDGVRRASTTSPSRRYASSPPPSACACSCRCRRRADPALKGHKAALLRGAAGRERRLRRRGQADHHLVAEAEGLLKATQRRSSVCYNAVSKQLASGTASDFGLWSPEQKSVAKHKVPSRVLCISWTNDGTVLTLGLFDGRVSLRKKDGSEIRQIKRSAPIWSLEWNPSREEATSLLAVGCWDQTLSSTTRRPARRDRQLGCDLCASRTFQRRVHRRGRLRQEGEPVDKEGVRLTTMAERDDWVWSCKQRPNANAIAVGGNDGTITMYQLVFSTVHGLYRERYAFREYMTDVVVQDMVSEQKVRIKCRAYVKKISIYKNRLAVQLPERLHIYEIGTDPDGGELRCRSSASTSTSSACSWCSRPLPAVHRQEAAALLVPGAARARVGDGGVSVHQARRRPAGREGLVSAATTAPSSRSSSTPFPVPMVRTARRCAATSRWTATRSRRRRALGRHRVLLADGEAFEEQNAEAVAEHRDPRHAVFSAHGQLSIKTAPSRSTSSACRASSSASRARASTRSTTSR